MRKIALMFVAFMAVTALSSSARAELGHHGGFDATFTAAVGVGTDGRTGGIPAFFRFSHERSFVGLEASFVAPYGVGANLLFYVYNGPRISVHIIDPGVFYSWGSEISAPSMPREFDISAGLGAEVHINSWLAVTLDWRVFLPDPFHIIPAYADYGLRSFGEAVKGGELWLGIQFVLY
jgi:hypothetical protein